MVKTRQASRLEDQQRKHRKLRNELDAIVDGAIVTVIQHCIDTAFDDDDTIARSTSALDRLKKASFTLLLERAKAFGRERKYTDAIADARKAIEYQPESAVGYITASYLYTIQEQHQEAITILESGLRTVPPSESLLLEGYHRAAKELLKQKTDFVLKLPVELTISIFTQLDNDYSLVQCVRVSKTWREFLLQQCPSLWSSANFGHHRLNPTASLLPSTSKYIRKLKVYGRDADYGPLFEKLIGILESKGSPRLHDIYIEIPSYDQVVKYAMRIIAPLRHQLTKVFFLTFDIDDFDVSFPLDQLLASCPNLEILQLLFSDENHVTYQPSQFTLDNYRLKKLLLTASNAESIFQQLIPRCPELECLEANICGQRTLALINQYCPRIRVLLAGQEMLVYPVPPNDDNHLGLYEVQYDINEFDEMQQLIPMVIKSKSTLATLVLTIEGTATVDALNQMAYHTFNQLEVLGLYVDDDLQGFGNIAARIIPQCPKLKNLQLCLDVDSPDRLFSSLTMLSHLEKLRLTIAAPSTDFQQFFAHHVAQGEKGTLHNIRIYNCDGITDDVLKAVSSIKTLQEITMDGRTEDLEVTPDGIQAFTNNLLALPNLKSTDLSAVPYISANTARRLAKINELNRKW